MDFFSDLKNLVASDLTQIGIKFSPTEGVEELLHKIIDYDARVVQPTPRTVKMSSAFVREMATLSGAQQSALKEIVGKLERGDDVTGHLSKGIENPEKPDLLLADWKVHHFHISNTKKDPNARFYDRAGTLAFGVVTDSVVYFLQIYGHGKKNVWTEIDLLKEMKREWPEALEPFRLRTITSCTNPDEKRLEELRRAGMQVPLQIDDWVIAPLGGGVTSAATPASHGEKADRLMKDIDLMEKAIHANEVEVKGSISRMTGVAVADLDFELYGAQGYAVREKATKTSIKWRSDSDGNLAPFV